MMTLAQLHRHMSRGIERGKGARLEAAELDLLAQTGAYQRLCAEAAAIQARVASGRILQRAPAGTALVSAPEQALAAAASPVITELQRRLSRCLELGRGVRLSIAEVDAFVGCGAFEVLAAAAAEAQRVEAIARAERRRSLDRRGQHPAHDSSAQSSAVQRAAARRAADAAEQLIRSGRRRKS
jgi:hypothetical protein